MRCMVNIEKSTIIHAKNRQFENEIKTFIIAPLNIKFLWINLMKDVEACSIEK